MRNGILVGYVASIPESENWGDGQIVEAIATADYDRPVGRSRPSTPRVPLPRQDPKRDKRAQPPATLAQRLKSTFKG
jgi:hypothetical protein